MNWKNVDLESYELDLNILDPYSFKILLLEVNCNLPEINEETVTKQFEETLRGKIRSAREIFNYNLKNIVKHANNYKNENLSGN